jgi:hypothetical protein
VNGAHGTSGSWEMYMRHDPVSTLLPCSMNE